MHPRNAVAAEQTRCQTIPRDGKLPAALRTQPVAGHSPTQGFPKKNNNQFCRDIPQEQSFNRVEQAISETPVLTFFDPKDKVEIQCDASDRGLGASLMQDGRPIAYASRSMTET